MPAALIITGYTILEQCLMTFLATTNIGCFPGETAKEMDRACRDDLRGLELVEEAEQRGEG
jgi:hypothetical protein